MTERRYIWKSSPGDTVTLTMVEDDDGNVRCEEVLVEPTPLMYPALDLALRVSRAQKARS
jgi:hypothetical protein